MTGVQIVGPLAETIIELTADECTTLAYAAASAAHALDDPRYNGRMNASFLDEHDGTTWRMGAWRADRPIQLEKQRRLRAIAHLIDPDRYDEDGKHRG